MGSDFSTGSWLEDGERLLWVGRASPGLVVARVLVRILGTVVLLWVVVRSTGAGVAGEVADVPQVLGGLVRENPLVAAIAALVLLALPVSAYLRHGRTRYAVTDRRLAAWGHDGRLRWTLPPDLVLMVRRGAIPFFGRADLRFTRWRYGERSLRWTAFRAIRDAPHVARLVREWLEERNGEVRGSVAARDRVASPGGLFSIEVPRAWTVRRYRAVSPEEASRINPLADEDPEDRPPTEPGPDWNVLVARGPFATSLSVEGCGGVAPGSDAVAPGSSLERTALLLLGAGEDEREEGITLGAASGHRSRRTLAGMRRAGAREQQGAYVLDQWLLERDDRWYRITACWSSALPAAEAGLAQVVGTFDSRAGALPEPAVSR